MKIEKWRYPMAEPHTRYIELYVCKQCNNSYEINETREKLEKKLTLMTTLYQKLKLDIPVPLQEWITEEWEKIE